MCVTCLLACGVQVGGGGRRRGEGQVETCRADGPRAVKGGREAWTDGQGGRVTSHSGWHLRHRQVRVYMGVTVFTKSRRRTCESSEAREDLAGWPVEDGGDTCRPAGDAYGVRYPRRVLRVWASKPERRFRGTDDTWRHRGVGVKAKLPHEGRGGRRI